MSRVEEKFAETFGISPLSEVVDSKTTEVAVVPDERTDGSTPEDDFNFVRGTLYRLLESGARAFEELSDIARTEEKISAYGTLNEMLNNLSDISIKLMEIHERKKKLQGDQAKPQVPTQVTNNNVFVGSSADLDKLLDDGDIIDV